MWERNYTPPSTTRSVQRSREYRSQHVQYVNGHRLPETELQALMEAAPHSDPDTTLDSTAFLRDRLADAIDNLEPRLKWIFEARHYEGMSIRQIGAQLSLTKSYVDRLYRQAQAQLAEALQDLSNGG